MDSNICKSFWILFVVLGVAYGYRSFQRRIPNGDSVPHPCNDGTTRGQIWDAVGHTEPYHVRSKNVFGGMFRANNFNWQIVCKLDADGDGFTNGQELGDPDCKWSEARPTRLSPATGHPGFCEPNRAQCSTGSSYPRCPNTNRQPGSGMRPPHRNMATPPPHAGKHPQALLTERLGNRAGGRGQGQGQGQPGFNNFGTFPSGFNGQQNRVPSLGGGMGQRQSFNPTPATPSFGQPPFNYPQDLSASRSFNTQSQGSFGIQSQPMPGPFGVQSQASGVGFWPQSPTSPPRGNEPSRDSFSRNLDQQFLQGGGSAGFTSSPFRSQSSFRFQQPRNGQQSLQNHVQRRIQNARSSGTGMGSAQFSGMNWQGSSPSRGMNNQQFGPPMFGQSGSDGSMTGGRFRF